MSRQAPIYISDSDEEPTEYSDSSSDTSAHESPSVHPRADTSDVHIAPPTVPAAPPATAPAIATGTCQPFAETSREQVLRRTPRMSVRDLPTGLLTPRDKAPMTEREIPGEEPSPKRLRPTHLDWMPPTLRRWRSLEGIPSTYEIGESSHAPSPGHLTGEPLELTVPTLVAVTRTIFGLHQDTRGHIRELQSDTSRLDGDVASIYSRLGSVETHVDVDRELADATRAHVTMLERRATVAGVMAGVSLLMTAVGLYFPSFH